MERLFILCGALCISVLLTACASVSPTYINDGERVASDQNVPILNPVHFEIADSFKTSPPHCVAVLPLHNALNVEQVKKTPSTDEPSVKVDLELTDEALEQLRWNLYAHLAPYSFQDVELDKVNKVVTALGNKGESYSKIASKLNCDALLLGEVISYSTDHFGIYSQVSVGVRMQLIRVSNYEILWQGHHIAKSQAGTIPLTPVDLVVGIYSATENVSEEQLVRVEDDLFRRLLSTWDSTGPLIDSSKQSRFAKAPNPELNDSSDDQRYSYSISVENLYLRSGPGTRFTAQAVLNQQDKLSIVNHKHSPWLQVKVAGGQLGYVNKKYIKSTEVEHVNEQIAALSQ